MFNRDTNRPDPTQDPREPDTTSAVHNTTLQTQLNQLPQGPNQEQIQIAQTSQIHVHHQPHTNTVPHQLQVPGNVPQQLQSNIVPQQLQSNIVSQQLQGQIQRFVHAPSQAMANLQAPAASLFELASVTEIKENVSQDIIKQNKRKHAEGQKKYRDSQKRKTETLETQVKNMRQEMENNRAEIAECRARDAEREALLKSLRVQVKERWPDQTRNGSKSLSTFTQSGGNSEVQKLFQGPPIDPTKSTKLSPDEPIHHDRNMTLGDQLYKSINYYIEREESDPSNRYWIAKHRGFANRPSVPLQRISGGRWDFILGVQLEDGTYLFGYLLKEYTR